MLRVRSEQNAIRFVLTSRITGAAERLFASVTIRSVPRFQVMLVGEDGLYDMARIRAAWHFLGADLLGPLPAHRTTLESFRQLDGVLIQLPSDAVATRQLSDRLDQLDIPFLFLMPAKAASRCHSVFYLSDDAADIKDMICRLSRQGSRSVRH
jgi:hypothetical protein